MKRSVAVVLAIALCLGVLAACGKKSKVEGAPQPDTADTAGIADTADTADTAVTDGVQQAQGVTPDDFRGCWEENSGRRVTMTIAPREPQGDMEIVIHCAAGARETAEWILYGAFDETSGMLFYANGTKNRITREGTRTASKTLRNDVEGTLSLLADGSVRWADTEEPDSAGYCFVRVEAAPPAIDDLADGFFRMIGGYQAEGEDAAAAQARAAYEAVRFALWNDMLSQDAAAMREMMLAAWNSMEEEERQAFAVNLPAVMRLVDACRSDYAGARGAFDGAGIGEEMEQLALSAYARACWTALCAAAMEMNA